MIMPNRYWTVVCFLVVHALSAQEKIINFVSDITINPDATMDVYETIVVRAQGDQIRRGIVREFPTSYRDYAGTYVHVSFNIERVTKDGHDSPYHVIDAPNGKIVYIGQKGQLLSPGIYEYQIHYRTDRQLGFFTDHDELFWNVTGNGWRLPIEHVEAKVRLPEIIAEDMVRLAAYTGFFGSDEQDYTVEINNGTIIFRTTRPLQRYEGLSIVVGWPKGVVQEPTFAQKAWWFMRDNLLLIILMLGWLLLLLFYVKRFLCARKTRYPGTIIPLFYPPKDCGPSGVGFMKKMGIHDTQFTAELINLAVHGYVTISYDPGLYGGEYSLVCAKDIPTAQDGERLKTYQLELLKNLFGQQGVTIKINRQHQATIAHARSVLERYCQQALGNYLAHDNSLIIGWCVTGIAWAFIIGMVAVYNLEEPLLFVVLAGYVLITFIAQSMLKTYTQEGRALQDAIDGFELFLTTTELERFNIIGTPPGKSPELYEQYLPYAIALGVEQQWTNQFSTLFAQLERRGTPYIPLWYIGTPYPGAHNISSINSSLRNAISAASTPPGRSSGFGSGGGSGRGGGGGGGGGW